MSISIQSLDDRPMETVGAYLKRKRESKTLSLGEVARLTKISELYLDCIEKDDYEKIPKGPYVKGYISSYAHMIGGDTQKALALYESANKTTPVDEPQFTAPPVKGWKASIARACSSMGDWIGQRFNHTLPALDQAPATQTQPHSSTTSATLVDKKKVVPEPIPPVETTETKVPANDDAAKVESSVLIPFKRIAAQNDDTAAPVPSAPAGKTDRLSITAAILRLCHRLVDVVAAKGRWLKSSFSIAPLKRWPLPSPSSLGMLMILLLSVAILVFCGIGVYHVFFFDSPARVMTEAQPEAPGNSALTASGPASLAAVPHKTARFKKPDSPLPSVAVVPLPEPVEPAEPTRPVEQPAAPAKPIDHQETRVPATPPQEAVSPQPEPDQPAEVNVNVLKATVCSAIRDRMPADSTTAFPLSVERVYVWSHIQAQQYPTIIRHIYYHESQIVNDVELNIRSPFWRTWSFKSIDKNRYRGHWRVDIAAEDGTVLRRLYFEIN